MRNRFAYWEASQFGSKADSYQALLEHVAAEGSLEDKLACAAEFYERVRQGEGYKLTIEWSEPEASWYRNSPKIVINWHDGDKMTLDYDTQTKRFLLRGQISDAAIAEVLHVPISYVEGLLDALRLVEERAMRACRGMASAKRSRERAVKERKRLRTRRATKREAEKIARQMNQDLDKIVASQNVKIQNLESQIWWQAEHGLTGPPKVLTLRDGNGVEIEPIPGLREFTFPSPYACVPFRMVYFLVDGEEVVYVGQTISGVSRPLSHLGKKTFQRIFFLPVDGNLDTEERRFIDIILPKYNADPLTRYAKRQRSQ